MHLLDRHRQQIDADGSVVDFKVWQDYRQPKRWAPDQAVFDPWNHPLVQAPLWSSEQLYYWQRRFLWHAAQPKSRAVISTNNSSGKTSLVIPLLGLSIMAAFPGSVVLSTAGAEEQIRGQLWKYLEAKCRPYYDAGWRAKTGENLEVWGPSIDGIKSRWIGRVPQKALTMEGYHQFVDVGKSGYGFYRPICVIMDEAKSIKDDIFQAMHRIDPDWAVVISTPAESHGPFYDAVDPESLEQVELPEYEMDGCPS